MLAVLQLLLAVMAQILAVQVMHATGIKLGARLDALHASWIWITRDVALEIYAAQRVRG